MENISFLSCIFIKNPFLDLNVMLNEFLRLNMFIFYFNFVEYKIAFLRPLTNETPKMLR